MAIIKPVSSWGPELAELCHKDNLGEMKGYTFAAEKPSEGYYFLIGLFSAFLMRFYLLVLTESKFVVIELETMNNIKDTKAYLPSEVSVMRISPGLIDTTVILKFPDEKIKSFTISKMNANYGLSVEQLVQALTGRTIDEQKKFLKEQKVALPGDKLNKIVMWVVIALFGIPLGLILLLVIIGLFSR